MCAELIRPRLVVQKNCYNDLDEYLWALNGWQLSASQLSSGQYFGSDLLLITEGFQFRFFQTRLKTLYLGHNQSAGPHFVIPLDHQDDVYHLDYHVGQSAICCIPPDRPVKVITPDNFEAVTLSLSDDFFASLCEENARFYRLDQIDSNLFFSTNSPQFNRLREELLKLYQRFNHTDTDDIDDPLEEWLFEHTEQTIMPLLAKVISSDINDSVEPSAEKFAKALSLILDNLDSPPTIFDLSSELGTTQRTLQYLFKQHAGIPPKQLISLLRLNTARSLLKRTDLSRGTISDIANVLGYWHMGRFSHEFKRLFGKNPSDLWAARSSDPDQP